MPTLLLTPASISYLNQFLLSALISGYLAWQLITRRHPQTHATRALLACGISTTLLFLLLWLDVTLLPGQWLWIITLTAPVLSITLLWLGHFAYHFPRARPNQRLERWLVLLVFSAYSAWECGYALWRMLLLNQQRLIYRPELADLLPIGGLLWLVLLFLRNAMRPERTLACRRFALIFTIPLWLACLNLLHGLGLVSSFFQHANISVGLLLTLFLFTLNYLDSQPVQTSFLVKLGAGVLTALLALFGTLAWLVAPAYAAQFRADLPEQQTLRFTPNAQGGYDLARLPLRFESRLGQNLGLTQRAGPHAAAMLDFAMPFFGHEYQQIAVMSDGLLVFGPPVAYAELERGLTTVPAIFGLLSNLNPQASADSGVFVRDDGTRLLITYERVGSVQAPQQLYSFQIVLEQSGSFELRYRSLPAPRYLPNDRPDAAIWAFGATPAGGIPQQLDLQQLPQQIGPTGSLGTPYLAFRRYQHEFLLPLTSVILGCSLLCLPGLPLILYRQLLQPLNRLIGELQAFDRNRPAPLLPRHNDEIGFLVYSFNQLAHELHSLINELESRVHERTADVLSANQQLRKLSIAIEQSPSAILIIDRNIKIEYANEAFTRTSGYQFAEVDGMDPRSLLAAHTPIEVRHDMGSHLRAGRTWRGELCNLHKSGEEYWEYTVIAPIIEHGQIISYVAIKEDITARKTTEQALIQSERNYRALFEMESDALFLIRAEDGMILEANGAASELYGYSHAELLQLHNTNLSAEPEATRQATTETRASSEVIHIPLRWHRKRDGTVFPVDITARFFTWQEQLVHLAAIRDCSEREQTRQQLERLTRIDPLTGLFNRRHFFMEGEKILQRSRQAPGELAVLMLDIDHFKRVNDRYGHQVGDAVLIAVARLLDKSLRVYDLLGRYGGEEFVALLPRATLAESCQIAERLVLTLREQPIELQSVELRITISAGLAHLCHGAASLDELLAQADQALYQAKNAGRNTWVAYEHVREAHRDC